MHDTPSGPHGLSDHHAAIVALHDRISYRRVDPKDETDPIFDLRYRAYRREGAVPESLSGIVKDEFDELPNAYTFAVHVDGVLVSTVRMHHVTPEFRESPSYSVFPDLLDEILDGGVTLIDPGRFATELEASLAFPALPYLTLRLPTVAVQHFDVRYVLSTVRPEHAAFYRRVYRSKRIGAERYYHGLSFPMVMMYCDIPEMYQDMLRRYPFFRSRAEERHRLFGSAAYRGIPVLPSVREALEEHRRERETA